MQKAGADSAAELNFLICLRSAIDDLNLARRQGGDRSRGAGVDVSGRVEVPERLARYRQQQPRVRRPREPLPPMGSFTPCPPYNHALLHTPHYSRDDPPDHLDAPDARLGD